MGRRGFAFGLLHRSASVSPLRMVLCCLCGAHLTDGLKRSPMRLPVHVIVTASLMDCLSPIQPHERKLATFMIPVSWSTQMLTRGGTRAGSAAHVLRR